MNQTSMIMFQPLIFRGVYDNLKENSSNKILRWKNLLPLVLEWVLGCLNELIAWCVEHWLHFRVDLIQMLNKQLNKLTPQKWFCFKNAGFIAVKQLQIP